MARDSAAGAKKETPVPIPHVLHVVNVDAFTRFGRMFRQLGLALSDEDLRVSLLTDDATAAADLDGTPVTAHLLQPLGRLHAWRLRAFLRRQFDPPPDAVHLWGTSSLGTVGEWTHAYQTALLIHVTSTRDIEHLKHRSLRSNEQVIAACEEHGKLLRELWPTLAHAVRVLKPGLLVPEQVPGLSVHGKTLGLVWAGTLDSHSGLEVLIEAVAQLRARGCDLQVALIGRGPATRRIWHEIRRRGVQDRFSLIAEPNVWDQAMVGADICVVPTCQRDLSLAPLLAMAMGKLVVASRDQVADWFIEDQTTLQFTPNSAVELAYHITRTAGGHPNVLAVARTAAEHVRRHHAVTKLASALARLYHASLSGQPGEPAAADRERSGSGR